MPYRWRTRFALLFLAGFMVSISLMAMPSLAAELDDSSLFVEAFNAYQKKDYLLTIEKIDQLSQIFPDSPLRDISLLLLARAGLYSGDNELAAKTARQFNDEFGDSPLKATLEDELLSLVTRRGKGEKLLPDTQLRAAALKVRKDQLAMEQAAILRAEQERLAKEQAERERIAQEKAEKERQERERIAAEKRAKESIKLAIVMSAGNHLIDVGKKGQMPFELVNNSAKSEEFLLTVPAPLEYAAVLATDDKPGDKLERVALAAGERIKGVLAFQMPLDRVDGYKATLQLKAISATYNDVVFSKDAHVTASAPLVRAVAKPEHIDVARGEPLTYHIALLNAGSLTARDLTMRVVIPPQLKLNEASGTDYRREAAGAVIFSVAALETGSMMEFNVNVNVRDNVMAKQELRLQLDVIDGQLQRKDTFTSKAAVVKGK